MRAENEMDSLDGLIVNEGEPSVATHTAIVIFRCRFRGGASDVYITLYLTDSSPNSVIPVSEHCEVTNEIGALQSELLE